MINNMGVTRYNFLDIFQENSDGSLSPRRTISVSGAIFGPETTFSLGVSFGGVDFHKYKYSPIAAELDQNGVLIVRGFYQQ